MKDLNECKEIYRGKYFSRSESGKTFVLQSDTEFDCHIIDIDHCVFSNDPVRRCDLLFLVPVNQHNNQHLKNEGPRAYYVELKGGEIRSACEQLYHTINSTKSQILNYDLNAIVVGTEAYQPDIQENVYYKKVRKIIKKDIRFHKVHKVNKFTHIEII